MGSLITFFPTELIDASIDEHELNYQSFDVRGLIAYNATFELNMTGWSTSYGRYFYDWDKSVFGHDFRTYYQLSAPKSIWQEHTYTFLGFYTGGHRMSWINKETLVNRGTTLYVTDLENDYDSELGGTAYTLKCDHVYIDVFITYNQTAYGTVEDAFDNQALYFIFGIEWSQKGTSQDAWSLISDVLLFRMVGGLEENWFIYAFISVPMWLAGIYISFIIVLRVIGALFGGGA